MIEKKNNFNSEQVQDNRLLEDILYRNYFSKMQNPDTNKIFTIILAEDDTKKILGMECQFQILHDKKYYLGRYEKTDLSKKFSNFSYILEKIYKRYNLKSNIELITDGPIEYSFLDILLEHFKNNQREDFKIIINQDESILEDSTKLETYIELFKKIKITLEVHFNLSAKRNLPLEEIFKFMNTHDLHSIKICAEPNEFCNLLPIFKDIIRKPEFAENIKDLEFTENTSDKITERELQLLQVFYLYYFGSLFTNVFQNDKTKLVEYLASHPNCPVSIKDKNIFTGKDCLNCKIHRHFYINNNTLEIVLCPSMQQHYNIIGKFDPTLEEHNIINNQVELQIVKDHIKPSTLPSCGGCRNMPICSGFCYGRAWESHGNFMIAVPEFCILQTKKSEMILNMYLQFDVLNDFLHCITTETRHYIYRTFFQEVNPKKEEGGLDE